MMHNLLHRQEAILFGSQEIRKRRSILFYFL